MCDQRKKTNRGSGGNVGVHTQTPPPIVTPTAVPNTKNIATDRPSYIGTCSEHLPQTDSEPWRPHIAFAATEVTYTIASENMETPVSSSALLQTLHPMFRPWPFVEWSRTIFSFCKQNKPNATYIHGRGSKGIER